MGPLALSMFSSSRFAVPPVDIVLLTRFMPLLSELLVDDQIRLVIFSLYHFVPSLCIPLFFFSLYYFVSFFLLSLFRSNFVCVFYICF